MRRLAARWRLARLYLRRAKDEAAAARLWLFAVIIGAAGAYGVIGLRAAIDAVSILAFGGGEEMLASAAGSLGVGRAWAAPVIGGVVVSMLMYLAMRYDWLPEGRGQGVADVIEARAVRDGRVSLRAGVAAAAISIVSIGGGASAGREGPAVHLGATIASFLDRYFGFSAKDRRTLLGCGAAAAVAASFNAPIAGVLFALEVVMGSYALSVFGPIAAASVTASIVIRTHLGNFPAFAAPDYGVVGNLDVPMAALLGLITGAFAIALLLSMERMTDVVRERARMHGFPVFLLPPLGGAIVGLMGAFRPEVFGVGYEAVTNALAGEYTMAVLASLVVMKIAATAVTLSFRFGGGVFSPSLVIGAFIGAAFGAAASQYAPFETAGPGFYAMIGMGAASGAIMGAPISTTLIVFELTGDYAMTISLMVAVGVATLITQSVAGKSFFHWQLSRRGYDLSEGPQGVILQTIRVRDVMEKMPAGAPLAADAKRLKAGQSLGEALALLAEQETPGLPVVAPGEESAVVGYLSRVKALASYNRALIDAHVEHHR